MTNFDLFMLRVKVFDVSQMYKLSSSKLTGGGGVM